MIISELLKVENIKLNIEANSKDEVLKTLISLVKTGDIVDEEKLFLDLKRREEAGSTALENGLAIPHVRSEYINHFSIAFATSKEGIDFDSIDGKKSKVFAFIATPMKYNNYHLEALSKIASLMYNPIVIDVLSNSNSKEGFINLIAKLEGIE